VRRGARRICQDCNDRWLDPEAISVAPPVYFPEVLKLARQLINTSVRRLEYEEILRLLHRSRGALTEIVRGNQGVVRDAQPASHAVTGAATARCRWGINV
jgi:hypothetical protein